MAASRSPTLTRGGSQDRSVSTEARTPMSTEWLPEATSVGLLVGSAAGGVVCLFGLLAVSVYYRRSAVARTRGGGARGSVSKNSVRSYASENTESGFTSWGRASIDESVDCYMPSGEVGFSGETLYAEEAVYAATLRPASKPRPLPPSNPPPPMDACAMPQAKTFKRAQSLQHGASEPIPPPIKDRRPSLSSLGTDLNPPAVKATAGSHRRTSMRDKLLRLRSTSFFADLTPPSASTSLVRPLPSVVSTASSSVFDAEGSAPSSSVESLYAYCSSAQGLVPLATARPEFNELAQPPVSVNSATSSKTVMDGWSPRMDNYAVVNSHRRSISPVAAVAAAESAVDTAAHYPMTDGDLLDDFYNLYGSNPDDLDGTGGGFDNDKDTLVPVETVANIRTLAGGNALAQPKCVASDLEQSPSASEARLQHQSSPPPLPVRNKAEQLPDGGDEVKDKGKNNCNDPVGDVDIAEQYHNGLELLRSAAKQPLSCSLSVFSALSGGEDCTSSGNSDRMSACGVAMTTDARRRRSVSACTDPPPLCRTMDMYETAESAGQPRQWSELLPTTPAPLYGSLDDYQVTSGACNPRTASQSSECSALPGTSPHLYGILDAGEFRVAAGPGASVDRYDATKPACAGDNASPVYGELVSYENPGADQADANSRLGEEGQLQLDLATPVSGTPVYGTVTPGARLSANASSPLRHADYVIVHPGSPVPGSASSNQTMPVGALPTSPSSTNGPLPSSPRYDELERGTPAAELIAPTAATDPTAGSYGIVTGSPDGVRNMEIKLSGNTPVYGTLETPTPEETYANENQFKPKAAVYSILASNAPPLPEGGDYYAGMATGANSAVDSPNADPTYLNPVDDIANQDCIYSTV